MRLSYIGLPDALSEDEDIAKRILDVRLNQLVGNFEGKGRIKEIAEIQVSFGGRNGKLLSSNPSSHTDLTENFTACEPLYNFDKVILPQTTKQEILEVLDGLNYQDLIFNQWGFKELEPNYNVALNFFGPPGTGKTMSAHAIAHHLGKKILSVDYAQIESKFVGDAPKNLDAVFKKANQEESVLFFDEADSFLGKRIAGISTGSEQAINSLRSQMLIALDRHTGIVIFSSNFIENYDKAFETRIRHIQFQLPDKQAVKTMLVTMLPESAPIDAIDYDEIASKCVGLSGRDIKNSLLLSAVKASRHIEKRITQTLITESVKTIRESLNSFNINYSKSELSDRIRKKIKEKSDE